MPRAICGPCLILLAAWAAPCQPAPSAEAFEAASVKAADAGARRELMEGGPGTGAPGQISYRSVSLSRLIQTAYGVKAYHVSGPDWMGTTRFDIVAKVPGGASKRQFGLMLQNLLAERFGLRIRHESRDLPGFELLAAKDGVKLKPASGRLNPDQVPEFGRGGRLVYWERNGHRGVYSLEKGLFRLVGLSQTAADLLTLCEQRIRLPGVDRTGLTGEYDYSFDMAPDIPAAAREPLGGAGEPSAGVAMEPGPDFAAAFQRQLGLKIEKKKIPVDVLVVERVNRAPVEN
jgi:uncharacterized protein (TIGR03435 family)